MLGIVLSGVVWVEVVVVVGLYEAWVLGVDLCFVSEPLLVEILARAEVKETS